MKSLSISATFCSIRIVQKPSIICGENEITDFPVRDYCRILEHIRDHSFSTYAKFSEKLTLPSP